RDYKVTGVQTCALPICVAGPPAALAGHVGDPIHVVAVAGGIEAGSLTELPLQPVGGHHHVVAGRERLHFAAMNRHDPGSLTAVRSEERRVGKEGRALWR